METLVEIENSTAYQAVAMALLVAAVVALALIYKRDLMMLQQNSYRAERYVRWFNQSAESTSMIRILGCIALFLILVHHLPFMATAPVSILIMIWTAVKLGRAKYKKPLVMTKRAKRIYAVMGVLSVVAIGLPVLLTSNVCVGAAVALGLGVVSPLILLGANLILKPVEAHINKKYYNDAERVLREMKDLKIIGVTGSYGKTSTKHYLHRILSEKYDVAMTPGSFNTTLGVIRTVRETLKPYNEIFIVEMGAKQTGDIKEICDLVHPEIGIVTAVGEQHLESFKTIENIQKTKFELVDALPADGLAVVNDDFEWVANRPVSNVECVRYAVRNIDGAQYVAKDIKTDSTGTTFTVDGEGLSLSLHTKLVGECNISNLMAAVIVALRLGVDEKKIAYAVEKIEQVEHRLNMKRTPGGITIIDDAFNSNPTGSRMAIDVLAGMTDGKRIVVTPGMIELGDRQEELNREFGERIAKGADVAIVVGEYNRDAIVGGLRAGGFAEENIMIADSFTEAQAILSRVVKAGDTVLYENDLPDTFK